MESHSPDTTNCCRYSWPGVALVCHTRQQCKGTGAGIHAVSRTLFKLQLLHLRTSIQVEHTAASFGFLATYPVINHGSVRGTFLVVPDAGHISDADCSER